LRHGERRPAGAQSEAFGPQGGLVLFNVGHRRLVLPGNVVQGKIGPKI
jgi:hypothetical protein